MCKYLLHNFFGKRKSLGRSNEAKWSKTGNSLEGQKKKPRPQLKTRTLDKLPWSQRLSFILYWQILRRESLLIFSYWHEALRAEKRKPLVATVGNLTFMPSAFDRRFWLEDIFNCSMSHMIGWIKYLWGWEWSVYVHLYGYVWRTFALSMDSLTREG